MRFPAIPQSFLERCNYIQQMFTDSIRSYARLVRLILALAYLQSAKAAPLSIYPLYQSTMHVIKPGSLCTPFSGTMYRDCGETQSPLCAFIKVKLLRLHRNNVGAWHNIMALTIW
jgi:hypothetical protein